MTKTCARTGTKLLERLIMNNEDLKPCPFCGGKAEVVYIKANQYVRCSRCGAVGANTFNVEDVIVAWNSRVSVKQNGEQLDTNSVASNQLNAKLTYADIKKMIKPLEWLYISDVKAHYAFTNKGIFFKCYKKNGEYVLEINGNNPVGFSGTLSKIKQAAKEFLVDLVAAALGVERSGE